MIGVLDDGCFFNADGIGRTMTLRCTSGEFGGVLSLGNEKSLLVVEVRVSMLIYVLLDSVATSTTLLESMSRIAAFHTISLLTSRRYGSLLSSLKS